MGFPSITVVKEDFAGAAGTLITGNWAQGRQTGNPLARDGAGFGQANTAAICSSRWTPATFRDTEVIVDLTTLPASGSEWVALYVRQQITGSFDAYEVNVTRTGAATWQAQIFDKKAGTFTSRASNTAVAWAVGNKLGVRCYTNGSGNVVIELWRFDGTTWGTTPLLTFTDSAVNKIVVAGEVEVEIQNTAARIDNFIVGAVTMVTRLAGSPRSLAVAHRQGLRRRFPPQSMEPSGSGQFERAMGPYPPQVIFQPPTLRMQTISTRLVAVAGTRRRFATQSRSRLRPPILGTGTTFTDNVSGTAAPTGSVVEQTSVLTLGQMTVRVVQQAIRNARLRAAIRTRSKIRIGYVTTVTSDTVTGSAAATGSLAAEQKLYTETPTGSAAATGSVVEQTSVLALAQMTVRTVKQAVRTARVRAAIRYRSKLGQGAVITVTTDVVTGAASPTGSVVEQNSTLTLAQMTVRTRLAALAIAQTKRRIRYRSRLGRGTSINVISDVVTGAASPTGTVAEAKVYTEAVSGTASPSGSVVESFSVLTLAQMTASVRLAAVKVARLRRSIRYRSRLTRGPSIAVTSDVVTGSASPSGSVTEQKLYTETLTGTAAPTGTATDARTGTDATSGSAAPSGSAQDARTGTDAVSGAASASGSAGDAKTGADAPAGSAGPSGSLTDAKVYTDAASGTAAPSGSVVESYFRGYADLPTGTANPSGSSSDALTHAGAPAGQANPGGAAVDIWTPPVVPFAGGAGGTDNSEPNWGPLITDRRSPRKVVVDRDGQAKVVQRKKRKQEDEDELLILGLLE